MNCFCDRELPLSIFIVTWMLKSVTIVPSCADIFPVHPVAAAMVAEPVRIKHTAVPITTTIRRGIIASK